MGWGVVRNNFGLNPTLFNDRLDITEVFWKTVDIVEQIFSVSPSSLLVMIKAQHHTGLHQMMSALDARNLFGASVFMCLS